MTKLPPGVARTSVPFMVKDIVRISDEALIRKVATHPDIARPGEVDIPALFRIYFQATKFVHPATGRYVLPLEGDDRNDSAARRTVVEAQLSPGFSEDQLARIADLVQSDRTEPEVARECVKLVGQLILPLGEGEEVPDEVADAAYRTLTEFSDVYNIFKYLRGRKARKKVEDYCAQLLPDEEHIGDYGHNLGAAAQGLAAALMSMRNLDEKGDVHKFFLDNPMTPAVIRVPKRTTTLDGVFEGKPLLASETIIVLAIGEGAKEAQSDMFLFGSGVDVRQCPFKGVFFSTVEDIQRRRQAEG